MAAAEATLPWVRRPPVEARAFAALRRRAMFECFKWDPQVEDVSVLSRAAIVLRAEAWREIAGLAERLAAEALEAESELLARVELHRGLGLGWRMRRALAEARALGPTAGAARVVRFDFHFTREGWRISEANTDVPGGFNEASGFAALVAEHVPGASPAGDPAGALAEAALRATGPGATVGFVHATAFSDDRQVMEFVARRCESAGLRTRMLAPDHLRWQDGRARIEADGASGPVDALFRFFPSEWLPNCPRACGWRHFFRGGKTPVSNPASAALTQSKRMALVWDDLRARMETWRRLLPETIDPRERDGRAEEEWVFKPAFGRVGADIGLAGVTEPKDLARIRRWVRRRPGRWVAQRRFEPLAMETGLGAFYPCVGVYTVDGRAAGAYGRLGARPLIDHRALDAAVLVERDT